jgi:hypothetical protein
MQRGSLVVWMRLGVWWWEAWERWSESDLCSDGEGMNEYVVSLGLCCSACGTHFSLVLLYLILHHLFYSKYL